MLTDELLAQIDQALTLDETLLMLTVIETDETDSSLIGNKLLRREDGTIYGSLGTPQLDEIVTTGVITAELAVLTKRRATDTVTIWTDKLQAEANAGFVDEVRAGKRARVRILIEQLRPQPCLLICGAGHIARALTQLGLILGFRAIVIDDRPEFANRSFFPDAAVTLHAAPFEQAIAAVKLSASVAVVIVTRGHRHDEDCLRLLLRSKAHYIGMIGSRRRISVVKELLSGEGFSESEIARIYAPIGLDIGARTPEEIALAILAEIIFVRNRAGEQKDQLDCRPLSRPQR